jgi:hypothetical protein
MKTNADITIYNKSVDPVTRSEIWTRHQVIEVTWENTKAINVLRSGLLEADRYTIYIPFYSAGYYLAPIAWQALSDKGNNWTLQMGDVMVRGLVTDEISSSFTISDLKRKYDDVAVIRSVDRMDTGSAILSHYQIGAN